MYTHPIIPNRKGDSIRVSCFYQVHRPNIHHGRGLHVVYVYYIIMCGACVVRRFVWGKRAYLYLWLNPLSTYSCVNNVIIIYAMWHYVVAYGRTAYIYIGQNKKIMVILKCSIYITLRAMRSCVPVEAAANEESIFARAKGHRRRRRRQLGRRGIGERIVCRRASQMRRVPRRRGRVNRRGGPTLGIDWDAAERRARGCV